MQYFSYFVIFITILYFLRELKNKITSSISIESNTITQNEQQIIINKGKINKQIFINGDIK